MTNPRHFKAPFNPKKRIWQEADRLRAAHPAGRELPVQIVADIASLIELASRLGRLATGLPTDKTELTGAENGPISLHLDFQAMLQKVYGQPIDVEDQGTAIVPLAPVGVPPAEPHPRAVLTASDSVSILPDSG